MKELFLIITIILISAVNTIGAVLVKANIIRGESFVTVSLDANEIEILVKESLKKIGYDIAESIYDEDLALLDLFIYQYPAAYPAITIIYRSKIGIHYFDNERIKLFGDRHKANLEIIDRLMSRFPPIIDESILYTPTVNDVISNNRVSLIGGISNSISKSYRSNYENILQVPENNEIHFFVSDGFVEYLNYCSSFVGFRKKLKNDPITIKLKINDQGRFELLNIESRFELKDKHEKQIQELVASFPLWEVDREIERIELILSVK